MTIQNLPLVTVVIPSYNHAAYVKESIQSIVDQDYSNIELIIIDDGSTDNSIDFINEMVAICQKRFTRFEFRHRPNKGLCATLNEALEWSKGKYFSPIASDDIALPHKISFLVSKIINTNFSAIFGRVKSFKSFSENIKYQNTGSIITHTFEDLMLSKNLPSAPAALIKTESIREVGGYAEDVKLEDRYMWLSLACNNQKLVTYPEILVLYRNHESNTTKNEDHMLKARIQVLNKFSDSSVYKPAIKKIYLMHALAISQTKTIQPIKTIIQTKNYNIGGLRVFIKALTPNLILKCRSIIFSKRSY